MPTWSSKSGMEQNNGWFSCWSALFSLKGQLWHFTNTSQPQKVGIFMPNVTSVETCLLLFFTFRMDVQLPLTSCDTLGGMTVCSRNLMHLWDPVVRKSGNFYRTYTHDQKLKQKLKPITLHNLWRWKLYKVWLNQRILPRTASHSPLLVYICQCC